jgi:hypothetical protein
MGRKRISRTKKLAYICTQVSGPLLYHILHPMFKMKLSVAILLSLAAIIAADSPLPKQSATGTLPHLGPSGRVPPPKGGKERPPTRDPRPPPRDSRPPQTQADFFGDEEFNGSKRTRPAKVGDCIPLDEEVRNDTKSVKTQSGFRCELWE